MQRIAAAPLPLVALKAISNGALASDKLPDRVKLFNWGANDSTKGQFIIDETSVAALAANQRAHGFERVALDFEHNTVPGSAEYERTREPRDVAGYGTPEIVPGDGLYLSAIQWTPAGLAAAKNFSDLSPTPSIDEQRRVIFLHSVALVRNGAVFDLTFLSAQPATSDPSMTPEQIQALIATALTAATKPLNDQIVALTADLKAIKEIKPPTPVITLTAADGKTSTLELNQLAAEFLTLKADLAATKLSAENAEKAGVVAKFAAEGKVPLGEDGKAMTPEALGALPLGVLKMLHASTPVTVPLTARGKKPGEGKSTDGLTGIARAIAAHQADRN